MSNLSLFQSKIIYEFCQSEFYKKRISEIKANQEVNYAFNNLITINDMIENYGIRSTLEQLHLFYENSSSREKFYADYLTKISCLLYVDFEPIALQDNKLKGKTKREDSILADAETYFLRDLNNEERDFIILPQFNTITCCIEILQILKE